MFAVLTQGSSCYDGVREYPDGVSWQPDACTDCYCRVSKLSCIRGSFEKKGATGYSLDN